MSILHKERGKVKEVDHVYVNKSNYPYFQNLVNGPGIFGAANNNRQQNGMLQNYYHIQFSKEDKLDIRKTKTGQYSHGTCRCFVIPPTNRIGVCVCGGGILKSAERWVVCW